jgi:uncharacterized heparinase superfamily protein
VSPIVSSSDSIAADRTTLMHRLHARLSGLARPAEGFVTQPEPRSIGSVARGRRLLSGLFQFAGYTVESKDRSIWDLPSPGPRFTAETHGFSWLDDLAAVGDGRARAKAREWTFAWITRFEKGRGAGWTPGLAGRRAVRLINHAQFLMPTLEGPDATVFYRALSRHTVFLSRRWKSAPPGPQRFEALTGLIYSGLALTGLESRTAEATQALGEECERRIDPQGAIATRNPEELLDIFTLLIWAESALADAERSPDPRHRAAIGRIAPVLRALRHADGGLARFHGGDRGQEGRLDRALAAAGVKAVPAQGLAMGYARLHAGRTSVIVDAAPPPSGADSVNAHASTLALEVTSGRRPLIVNCGAGRGFGADWHRAGRATPSHSTLCIRGLSSARLDPSASRGSTGESRLQTAPDQVWAQSDSDLDGLRMLVGHNGYAATHGLTHVRQLGLTMDGRILSGEDTLGAMTAADRKLFSRHLSQTQAQGVRFDIRFHLHPDADAALDLGGTAVSIALKSGELWIFRHDGVATLALEPSVYLQAGRPTPRPARQIVLSATVVDFACQIGWTLAKAQDTPTAIRDIGGDPDGDDDPATA